MKKNRIIELLEIIANEIGNVEEDYEYVFLCTVLGTKCWVNRRNNVPEICTLDERNFIEEFLNRHAPHVHEYFKNFMDFKHYNKDIFANNKDESWWTWNSVNDAEEIFAEKRRYVKALIEYVKNGS